MSFFPFHRWWNWGTRSLSALLTVPQPGTEGRVVSPQPHSLLWHNRDHLVRGWCRDSILRKLDILSLLNLKLKSCSLTRMAQWLSRWVCYYYKGFWLLPSKTCSFKGSRQKDLFFTASILRKGGKQAACKAIHHRQLNTGQAHARHGLRGRFHAQLGKYMEKMDPAPRLRGRLRIMSNFSPQIPEVISPHSVEMSK